MSWEEKKALNRIYSTFKRLKTGIFKEDVEALKTLNEFNESISKKTVHGNLVFAKLYCICLRQNLNYYGSVKLAIKGINKELRLPLDFQIEQLTKEINHNEFIIYLKESGVDMSITSNNENIIKENKKEFTEKFLNSWSKKQVEESFYKSANDVLKEINNYV